MALIDKLVRHITVERTDTTSIVRLGASGIWSSHHGLANYDAEPKSMYGIPQSDLFRMVSRAEEWLEESEHGPAYFFDNSLAFTELKAILASSDRLDQEEYDSGTEGAFKVALSRIIARINDQADEAQNIIANAAYTARYLIGASFNNGCHEFQRVQQDFIKAGG